MLRKLKSAPGKLLLLVLGLAALVWGVWKWMQHRARVARLLDGTATVEDFERLGAPYWSEAVLSYLEGDANRPGGCDPRPRDKPAIPTAAVYAAALQVALKNLDLSMSQWMETATPGCAPKLNLMRSVVAKVGRADVFGLVQV